MPSPRVWTWAQSTFTLNAWPCQLHWGCFIGCLQYMYLVSTVPGPQQYNSFVTVIIGGGPLVITMP